MMSTENTPSQAFQGSRPIVSFPASQSLQARSASKVGPISTGLPQLDEAISPPLRKDIPEHISDRIPRGIPQGHITEVFGPPGAGKTTLALSIASNALRRGNKVVWIDTGPPLPRPRFRSMLLKSSNALESSQSPEDLLENLIYFRVQSLPHLLAILLHPPAGFPPEKTSLLVIDSVSGPFPSYFPNPTELKSRLSQWNITNKAQIQWHMSRNWNVTSDLANKLLKMAATHRLAVVAINQARTRIRGQRRATLCPTLTGGSWESSLYTRIVLYHDFYALEHGIYKSTCFAEVTKRLGKALILRHETNVIPFKIEADGLHGLLEKKPPPAITIELADRSQSTSQKKRKAEEIADSQDEDDSDAEYGWDEGDDLDLLENN